AAVTTSDTDIDHADFFDCPTGTPNCANNVGTDTSAPFSITWDISGHGDGDRVLRAVATDAAGNTGSDTKTITIDRTAPTGVTVSYADGYDADGTVTITTSNGSASGSGLDLPTATLERATATLSGGACTGGFGAWT